MVAINFGINLLKLHLGADYSQIKIRQEDANQTYRGKKIPLSVTLSCTHYCNLNCIHCQSENSKTDRDVPTDRFLDLIDEIAESGCKRVGFTGGEPLIRKDIGKIIEKCVQRDLIVSVVSNGTLVPNKIHELKGIRLLFLSLDGNREVHDMIRSNGNFDQVIKAAKLAREHGIPVAFLSTLGSMNYPCLDEMIAIVIENKAHWMVGMVQTEFTRKTDQNANGDRLVEIIDKIKKMKNLRTSKRYLNFLLMNVPLDRCFAGIGYCIIDPKGTMYPCFPAQFDKTYKGVSIMEKKFGEAFQEIPLYRRLCQKCSLACHIETNYLYQFYMDNIWNSYKLMFPVKE